MGGRRVVVEVSAPIHRELRRVAAFNDLKLYELTDALLSEVLKDEERVRSVVRRLKIG